MPLHRDSTLENIHRHHRWEVNNQAGLDALVPDALDIHKVAYKKDDDTYHVLKSVSPTVWVQTSYTKAKTDELLGLKQGILTEGAFVDGDKRKLDNIEDGATADQTASEIKTAYESNADTNALTDSLLTLLTTKKVNNITTDAVNDKLVITYTDDTVANLNINDIVTDVHVSGATLDATTNVLTLTSTDGGADVTVNLSDFVNSSELTTALNTKQDNLVSGTNIKTINGESILGSGNIEITGGGSGGGYFTGTAGITVGGITTGDTFKDVPVTDMINNLINPELTPNLTNPNNVLTSTVSGLREIGTSITPRLTATFNRGSISPQYSASEPYRAGLPTKYVFTSTAGLNQEVETDATTYGIDVSSFEVALGTVTFSSNISYSAGPQPTTSKGNVFDNPLPAGTTGNKTVTITGVYPCYNGISTLTKMTLANHGGTITVDAPADMNVGGERFKIQYPTVWSAKTPVVQQENELSKAWDNQNISDYSITTIDKNGVSYKQVEYVGAGIGARKLRLVF